ncbi:MAG TPA: sensor histidine kinase [Angustibacter sp.]|nr:sensor histidine kinase [Angustibacter sp.]
MPGAAKAQAARRRLVIIDGIVVVALCLTTEALVWTGAGPGDPIAGPRWLTAWLPLLTAMPLLWRRRRPVAVCAAVFGGFVLQALISGHSAEGLEAVVAMGMAAYSVAAFGLRRDAFVGLAIIVFAYGTWTFEDANVRSGRGSEGWAGAFFALYLFAVWLIGAAVQARRESKAAAARAAAVEETAARAVAEERNRIARELHDIVSHNLSVVIVQAAGSRAVRNRDPDEVAATLEKIETSGREALGEMRRLLGVLRADAHDGAGADLAPTPNVDQLDALASTVRASGVAVDLRVDGAAEKLPPALGLSVYRIVQEALTNVLKHAGPDAHARVVVRRAGEDVFVEVHDDGRGLTTDPGLGHGLQGMRERVTLLGGDLTAGARREGGFAVLARLPAAEVPS